jgi:hypothetical protein
LDLFDEITASLKPLGGDLFIDEFVRARRASIDRQQTEREAAANAAAAAEEALRAREAERRSAERRRPAERRDQPEDEVEAFMNRDRIEGADDTEIQEFLKDRSGFDPSQFE